MSSNKRSKLGLKVLEYNEMSNKERMGEMSQFVCFLMNQVAEAILQEAETANYLTRPTTRTTRRRCAGRSSRTRCCYFDVGDATDE